jgi:hypothetical protein
VAQFLLSVLLLGSGVMAGAATSAHRLYFAREATEAEGLPGSKAEDRFYCDGKIYAVLDLTQFPAGRHQLQVLWYDPHGKRREFTEYEFLATRPRERVWAWLKLHRPSGSALDRMVFLDNGSGMEEFVGQWTVKVFIDGDPLEKASFSVYC